MLYVLVRINEQNLCVTCNKVSDVDGVNNIKVHMVEIKWEYNVV